MSKNDKDTRLLWEYAPAMEKRAGDVCNRSPRSENRGRMAGLASSRAFTPRPITPGRSLRRLRITGRSQAAGQSAVNPVGTHFATKKAKHQGVAIICERPRSGRESHHYSR
jgi:hypothetical protein